MRALLALLLLTGCVGRVADDQPLRPGERTREIEVLPFEPVSPLARRLTREEVLHTLEDSLGVTAPAAEADAIPDDLPVGGFVNTGQGQATLPDHVRAYSRLATAVTAEMDLAAFVDAHAGCRDPGCEATFVASAGAQLFRRPLDAREQQDFEALFAAVAAEEASFDEAAGAVLEAMLQSPQFLYLYLDETAEERVVRGHAMASRLSYFLWLSAPDEALRRAAEAGELDSAEGVAAQAERMLDDPRARRSTARFIYDWARLATLPNGDGLKPELVEATVAFYQDHVWERGEPLLSILTSQSAALTPALAERWHLESLGDGVRFYDTSELEGRGGLLTQPGIVAGMTNADGGEIVARGLFLLDQMFCRDAPSPPADLQTIIDGFLEELPEDASDRLIAETRLERGDCATCHATFDPLAYGFEQLDYRGGFRTEDDHGNVMRTDGWIPGQYTVSGFNEPYADLDEYTAALARNPEVQMCFAQRHVEHAMGTQLGDRQRAAARDLAVELVAGGGDYRALVLAIVRHDVFRTYAAPEEAR
ncbi:MAG: DUF1592 domain-containing protein [Myxococcota bacterium]|nr:DUF1592 domain-containing protein [Myxococcota bacterium]